MNWSGNHICGFYGSTPWSDPDYHEDEMDAMEEESVICPICECEVDRLDSTGVCNECSIQER